MTSKNRNLFGYGRSKSCVAKKLIMNDIRIYSKKKKNWKTTGLMTLMG